MSSKNKNGSAAHVAPVKESEDVDLAELIEKQHKKAETRCAAAAEALATAKAEHDAATAEVKKTSALLAAARGESPGARKPRERATEEQVSAVFHALAGTRLSNAAIQKATSLTKNVVTSALAQMLESGSARKVGTGPATTYELRDLVGVDDGEPDSSEDVDSSDHDAASLPL